MTASYDAELNRVSLHYLSQKMDPIQFTLFTQCKKSSDTKFDAEVT